MLGRQAQHPKAKLNGLEDGHLPPCHPTAMWRGGHGGDHSTLPDGRPAAAGDPLLSPCLQLRPVLISGGVWRVLINHWSCLCVSGQSTLQLCSVVGTASLGSLQGPPAGPLKVPQIPAVPQQRGAGHQKWGTPPKYHHLWSTGWLSTGHGGGLLPGVGNDTNRLCLLCLDFFSRLSLKLAFKLC